MLADRKDLLNGCLHVRVPPGPAAPWTPTDPRAGPDGADTFDLAQDVGQGVDAAHVFDNAHEQQLPVGVEGPDVRGLAVVLRGEAPVGRCQRRRPAAFAFGLKVGAPGTCG